MIDKYRLPLLCIAAGMLAALGFGVLSGRSDLKAATIASPGFRQSNLSKINHGMTKSQVESIMAPSLPILRIAEFCDGNLRVFKFVGWGEFISLGSLTTKPPSDRIEVTPTLPTMLSTCYLKPASTESWVYGLQGNPSKHYTSVSIAFDHGGLVSSVTNRVEYE
jgi:hypothetical protein